MNVYILYILILQHFLNNRHDMYALFHLKQTNKLLYQLSLNINVKINDILKKYFSRSNIYIYIIKGKFTKRVTYINLCPKISYPKMLCKSVDMEKKCYLLILRGTIFLLLCILYL